MRGHGEKLSRHWQKAIAALLAHPSIAAAAASIGIAEATLNRWLRQADFQRAYQQARHAVVDATVGRLQAVSLEAANVLHTIMTDVESHTQARVAAAKLILEATLKTAELEDVVKRIEQLEQVAAGLREALDHQRRYGGGSVNGYYNPATP